MKRIILVALVAVTVVLLLTRCRHKEDYTLAQPAENITGVEIVYVGNSRILCGGFYESIKPVCTIAEEDWEAFFTDFYAMDCSGYLNDPNLNYEGELIRITYSDGGFEVIGTHAGFYCTKDRDQRYIYLRFDEDLYQSLISKWKLEARGAQGTASCPDA